MLDAVGFGAGVAFDAALGVAAVVALRGRPGPRFADAAGAVDAGLKTVVLLAGRPRPRFAGEATALAGRPGPRFAGEEATTLAGRPRFLGGSSTVAGALRFIPVDLTDAATRFAH